VTKASPFSLVGFGDQLTILAIPPLLLFLIIFPISLLVFIGFSLAGLKKYESFTILLLPSILVGCAAFLLIDNFTYTIFGFNAGTYADWRRYFYLLGFLLILWFVFNQLKSVLVHENFAKFESKISGVLASVLLVSVFVCITKSSGSDLDVLDVQSSKLQKPNIIIFSSDGLRAKSMSAYGYKRNTTPFIKSLLPESLVFENHFANSAKTTGSVLSMLSGKLPTTTRVIFRPDVFTGRHVYQHLPAILRKLGYYNADISVRHYVDAYDINMRDGFDLANNRMVPRKSALKLPPQYQESFGLTALFVKETSQRIIDRLKHISGIKDYHNPFKEVTALDHTSRGTDEQRLADLKKFVKESPRPFFASVHMLNTHGKIFHFRDRKFSKGRKKQPAWDQDFYDDAILNFDIYVKELVEVLKEEGLWENTIFVINSDHGMRWSTTEAIPLIIHFPKGAHVGRVTQNTQRIDIAPTLLDYVGAKIPDWMEGISLLSPEREKPRNIFVGNRAKSKTINGWREVPNPKAPFYTLGSLILIRCNQWFALEHGA